MTMDLTEIMSASPSGMSEEEVLAESLPDAYPDAKRAETRKKNREYPKPTEMDVLTLKEALEAEWAEWRYGNMGAPGNFADPYTNATAITDGIPGVIRTRAMRYHQDKMPGKYQRYMNSDYRFRTNWTASEIDRTVALATRNFPKVLIPPGSRKPHAKDLADRETRWAQYLLPQLEKQAGKPLLRIFADGLFEAGLAGFEVFLTDSYDDIDLDQGEDETDEDYLERSDEQLQAASANKLPIGIRVPDPLAILYEEDDLGICKLLIVENKPYRVVYEELQNKLTPQQIEDRRLPKPGTSGWPDSYTSQGWGSPGGDALTVRYYDRRWVGFIVAGKFVDGPAEHGMPGVPFIPAWGNVTSSARKAEQLQGVVWGMVEQEQAVNDLISTMLDVSMTYSRPKPVIETDKDGQMRDPTMGPQVVKLDKPDEAPELMPGQRLKDAFADFGPRIPPDLLSLMIQIRQQSGINPIAAGESPGSDPSGFAVNTLQAASQMRYEILLDNYSRALGMLIDFIRRMVKDGPIADKVFVPIKDQNGAVEYLGLGPDDITAMPSEVFIDPMNDVNRLAIRSSLIAGNQAGYIPRSIVQTQGYGADDPTMWDNEIADDVVSQQLLGMAVEVAKQRIGMGVQPPPQESSGLVGPDGQPISSRAGDDNEMRSLGGMPREDRGTGRMARSDGGQTALGSSNEANAARSRGGQAPASQGAGAQVPQ